MSHLTPLLALVALELTAGSAPGAAPPSRAQRHRLLVLTDISSLTAGVREPDDGQSLLRLLLYANEIDLEGLIATSNLRHGQRTRPELIRQAVDAYAQARPNLLAHSPDYPPAGALRRLIHAGQPVAELKVPVADSVGPGKDTAGSDWIIRAADRPDPRPLWVAVWGGSADLAQALWKVRQTRSPARAAAFRTRLRVHSISDQDSTGPWIRKEFPDLFLLFHRVGYRGMYRGGDVRLAGSDWVESNVKRRGPLGALYPNYRGGDIWSRTLGPVRGVKEGDTPSFLNLVANGLTDPAEPTWGGWGGRFVRAHPTRPYFTDARAPGTRDEPESYMAEVHRWRPAFQADFAARLAWSALPFARANHPPRVRVRGSLRRTAAPGERVALDARGCDDPDGHRLTFAWSLDRQAGSCPDEVRLDGADRPLASLTVPPCARQGRTLHAVLAVTDDGAPRLTRYRRVVLTVGAATR